MIVKFENCHCPTEATYCPASYPAGATLWPAGPINSTQFLQCDDDLLYHGENCINLLRGNCWHPCRLCDVASIEFPALAMDFT